MTTYTVTIADGQRERGLSEEASLQLIKVLARMKVSASRAPEQAPAPPQEFLHRRFPGAADEALVAEHRHDQESPA